jgi:hypothetical protein
LFSGLPKERKPVDYKKKLPTDGRPLYLDAQATTPMVRLLRTLSDVRDMFNRSPLQEVVPIHNVMGLIYPVK